ncbi:MAG: MgtC/SapB family protein [Pseudomonadota bacterium]|nr:MgtC/SapB family protein [Pseudomonadota bacterium]
MDLSELISIQPYDWLSIGTALLCGFIIGLERQLRGKPVGIRTSSLITLGTYIFIVSAVHVSTESSDPSRVIGQVITGIGFLGAGVMLARDGMVIGVTSAATIWALAAVGVCIAVASHGTAIKLSVIVVFVLVGVDLLEDYSQALTRGVHARYRNWRQRNGNVDGIERRGGQDRRQP